MKELQLVEADTRVRMFVQYAWSLPRLYEQAMEYSEMLNTYGVSSPRIMSLEEAKYQKGTRIYSDINLLEAIERETEAWLEYHEASLYCNRMAKKLAKLDNYELNLLYLKYEKFKTLDEISAVIHYSRTQTMRLLDNVLRKL